MTPLRSELRDFNTMRMQAKCRSVIPVFSEQDVFDVLVQELHPLKIIGGGSNILITKDQDAYILKNEIKGIEIIDEDGDNALVKVGAGENWHLLVLWTISHGLGGIENLALIPGCVGAAPMQNIGAYGVEQESVFHSLQAIDLVEGTTKTFYKEDCKFGYRESIFKNEVKGKYIITHVNYLFSKHPKLNTSYGAINQKLQEKQVDNPTIEDVAHAVIEIRQSKLPDPKIIPNTGSFFKNPVVGIDVLESIKVRFPSVVSYPVDEKMVKIPAAWLIQHAGYKGMRHGDAATHENHALVLVNHGNATGNEMLSFAEIIQNGVEDKFGIRLVPEVNIW
ncbi:MAG: UDP-N-acetylmuramate dehydrogenase [Saprospiraceae bacterium]|nr:UDP-N-acetylmuramate dehydrogenase [Saprospiraceae bacterium]